MKIFKNTGSAQLCRFRVPLKIELIWAEAQGLCLCKGFTFYQQQDSYVLTLSSLEILRILIPTIHLADFHICPKRCRNLSSVANRPFVNAFPTFSTRIFHPVYQHHYVEMSLCWNDKCVEMSLCRNVKCVETSGRPPGETHTRRSRPILPQGGPKVRQRSRLRSHDRTMSQVGPRAGHLRYYFDFKKIESTYFFKTITL